MTHNSEKTCDEVSLTMYRRHDGSVVVHVDTPGLPENADGPLLTVYLNDGLDEPLWDNQDNTGLPSDWRCPGCHECIEPLPIRVHRNNGEAAPNQ